MVWWFLLAVILVLIAYVRLAPTDIARFHQKPTATLDQDMVGGAIRRVNATLQEVDAIALATPRTRVLDGSVEEGFITYITRSAVIGFPDYTSVVEQDGTVTMHARLRFGRSDLGVNRRRLEGWIARLKR